MNINPIRKILQEKGKGIPSYCTANGLVIRALLEQAKRFDAPVLLEATANQVNQFGGYTGMQPVDYRNHVYAIADKAGFPRGCILLGGDHLGPLTWAGEPEESAMAKAEELVRLFVLAGYTKIHLDTSMRLADDPTDVPLSDETIARRGARLYKACDEAYARLLEREPDAVHPVYIIGSEVPIPGGATQAEEGVPVTDPSALQHTIAVYRQVFETQGLADAFQHIVGVVVQPGVEFGDDEIHHYRRSAAAALCEKARELGITLEGHSTDYQSPKHLREMCEDGIAILKVGPAATFALRAGLFALSFMEEYLIPREKRADFMGTLERVMLEAPGNWARHYHGTQEQLALKRRFSFSDRCRYYFALPEVQRAMDTLLGNLRGVHIPLSMLHQYMPIQYARVRDGQLPSEPEALLFDCVREMAEDYNYAAGYLANR
ncbi:MAG: class II D-tagatose-bisphosphate aldolase, non-catalytic subunit [Clostridiales bacterium]|nr:class II D-tagatose-bisphosphate aldolase, non-catalytic subunit [Bacillota bacterium]NLL53558.1 class II D-tagatose-bisphosphate aldolase, non-catalytic subunit [Clostridiales bacterium]